MILKPATVISVDPTAAMRQKAREPGAIAIGPDRDADKLVALIFDRRTTPWFTHALGNRREMAPEAGAA